MKNLTPYRYHGPISGVTLIDGKNELEVMLHDGAVVELPAEHEYTLTLLAEKRLSPVRTENPPTPDDKVNKERS
ncbi:MULTISPECIES: hypothetical protein [Yersinia pseudotuberculosis complex]|uniref:hypothetical protein n=1 Tax=Yersinia pseudotuberculosis complex TaxID=1649845 RepID=UPI00061CC48F|nr:MULTISPECIES: hypothetical protein [Yersinia pseudotuberculosis complex]MBO1554562.1 hypothetical protein [Yersinia pseudotuberculosis]MBO1561850.1 hypothetical protein [Yersinia pseudotuberculosis]CNC37481.1 Uncharacterised protein [Yersinia similis]CRY70828.1 Uncharacterised protein [Yersinia pseudotuberculosis]SUQ18058.1 Uncharacterised protein [Yersinia pseudotuberculosis]